MKRIRKAVVAGLGAGTAAAVTLVGTAGLPTDAKQAGQLAGTFLAAALPVAWATWRVPNAKAGGAVTGSAEYWAGLGRNPDGTPHR